MNKLALAVQTKQTLLCAVIASIIKQIPILYYVLDANLKTTRSSTRIVTAAILNSTVLVFIAICVVRIFKCIKKFKTALQRSESNKRSKQATHLNHQYNENAIISNLLSKFSLIY